MSTEVTAMIDELVLSDLMLSRQISRTAKLTGKAYERHVAKLRDASRANRKRIVQLYDVGGADAVQVLTTCIQRGMTSKDVILEA